MCNTKIYYNCFNLTSPTIMPELQFTIDYYGFFKLLIEMLEYQNNARIK